ncbi:hypothetical protein HZQ44_02915 [Elizabethkingia anophelis]|nr:hypothetical protein [Elizabethkingia anophelis]MCT3694660.1 hypothetical protein [Elizabethkingia anophelis]MCT3858112.1 hypothetical protein [Elizabethkingia anophelis]MCT3911470.1 hypothetical protein [Elizabethkingia anophelis]MCT4311049.1 hypothetical protein [Elizabethkingia anophelis]
MWTVIIILAIIAVIALLFLNSNEDGNQVLGAYLLGNLLPALVKLAIMVGVIVLLVKACS